MIFSFSLLMALIASAINPNFNQIGDVVFYYNEYINGNYVDSLLNLKFARLAVFHTMVFFDLQPRFYTFISIFLLCINLFYYGVIILSFYNEKIETSKKKIFFLLTAISSLPIY
ncbi:hypothetical protein, partial [Aliivibrio fischeri]|uniref:hypothetical protein n=1 Tax=Aliivibrio fischeri TaxID=668 RepID=UPI003552AEB7